MMSGGKKAKSLLAGHIMASRNLDFVGEDLVYRVGYDFTHGYIAAGGDGPQVGILRALLRLL